MIVRDLDEYRPPASCPVCDGPLSLTRLQCHHCGTELVSDFTPCAFCSLSDADLDLLRVFLASRGNLREVEKHLGVSYPTTRSRLTQLLVRLGLADSGAEVNGTLTREQVLAEVRSGALTPEEAAELIVSM